MELTILLGLAALLAACGGGSNEASSSAMDPSAASTTMATSVPSLDERAELLSYESSAPLHLVEKRTKSQRGAEVADVVFDAADRKVSAFLVRPQGKPRAAVLWAHWYGEEANANRTEFLPDALVLAKDGVVSLLPQASSRGRRTSARTLRRIRTARSPKSFSSAASTCSNGRPATSRSGSSATTTARCSRDARRGQAPADPQSDRYVPGYVADKLAEAASEPNKVESYETGHELNEEAGPQGAPRVAA
jgi:hypothetical protein